ncbi:MAG: C4-type zinc ribbon domain-containing protein [Dehalococcoidia bacterium]
MNSPERLHRLQQIDIELRKKHQDLDDMVSRLADNRALVAAESQLASDTAQLEDVRSKQKTLEWELEDLNEKARQTNSKLFGGTTRNPKELVNLEKEAAMLKGQIGRKEDLLLALIDEIEAAEGRLKTSTDQQERLKQEWEARQETLGGKKSEVEAEIGVLVQTRSGMAGQVDSQALALYERIRLTRELAVVKVERGRCQGCHITVPTSQWQKAKAGNIVQCGSCNRILSSE